MVAASEAAWVVEAVEALEVVAELAEGRAVAAWVEVLVEDLVLEPVPV